MKKIFCFVFGLLVLIGLTSVSYSQAGRVMIRDIRLSQTAYQNSENFKRSMLRQFDCYEFGQDGSMSMFSAQTLFDGNTSSRVVLMSAGCDPEDVIIESLNISFDRLTERAYLSVEYSEPDNGIIRTFEADITPVYDERSDDYVICLDGYEVSLRECVTERLYDRCAAAQFKKYADDAMTDLGGIGGALILVALAAGGGGGSLSDWIGDAIFGSPAKADNPELEVESYQVKINGKMHNLVKYTSALFNSLNKSPGIFYAALADYEDTFVYISPIAIGNVDDAAQALSKYQLVPSQLPGSTKSFFVSTYTCLTTDAELAARNAYGIVTNWASTMAHHDNLYHDNNGAKTGVYFLHWHPGPRIKGVSSPHSFYGTPKINGVVV
jgi:hypothetical protein